jgi:isoleucyl-tRNA synthetase
MHVGHARGRVYKDIVLRYKLMRGFNVWRRAGWDCQGLPTELEVEKRLNITSKKDLEKIGLERFVEEANRVIDYYISHWRSASERLGLWLDYDNAYETRRNEYMEHVWALLKHAYMHGDLVESLRVVPTCPHCETPLSQHELAQGYEEVRDPSIYVKFPLPDSGKYIVIWTTTPWTIPGNEAVAIDPERRYIEVVIGGERWIIAEETLDRFVADVGFTRYRVGSTYTGRELLGTVYYHPLADEVPVHRGHVHRVIAGKNVSMDEGTGCVHIAPAHGPEDFTLGQENGLPVFCPVMPTGFFTADGGRYAGRSVEEVSKLVVEDLKSKGLLVKSGEIVHNYPLCWRCGTKLIYLASVQWFLKVERIKKAMVEGNNGVRWWPEWAGRNRFGEWLENAEDWCISRTKVWGTPLPVWKCESCGERLVIGSKAELDEAEEKPNYPDLHRPWIDRYIFRCQRCGGRMVRLPFVLDTWLDSGVAHFASVDALRHPNLFQKLFPYDFITEAIDQTRGWFYTLLFTSTILFGKPPYKTVLNQGHVLDEFGKKMSKSRGNVIWAYEAFDKYGADPLRLYLVYKAEPWSTINFVPAEVAQVREQLNILWNIFSFATTYFSVDGFKPEEHHPRDYVDVLRPEDMWILTRTNRVVQEVAQHLEEMEINNACRKILSFIVEDLSRTYVRAIRRRAWSEILSREKLAAYSCLHYALKKSLHLLAPFAPYISDALYDRVRQPGDPESIHLADWPIVDNELIWDKVESYMEVVKDVLTAILAARQRGGRKLRTPVSRIIISPRTSEARDALLFFSSYLTSSSNCRSLEILDVGATPRELVRELDLNLRSLGPRLGGRLQMLMDMLGEKGKDEILGRIYDAGKAEIALADGSRINLTREDIVVRTRMPDRFSMSESRYGIVYVDTTLAEDLEAVAAANEVIRRVQLMRKEADLNILDRIECILVSDPAFTQKLLQQIDYIEEETRARLEIASRPPANGEGYLWREWRINDVSILIGIRRS